MTALPGAKGTGSISSLSTLSSLPLKSRPMALNGDSRTLARTCFTPAQIASPQSKLRSLSVPVSGSERSILPLLSVSSATARPRGTPILRLASSDEAADFRTASLLNARSCSAVIRSPSTW